MIGLQHIIDSKRELLSRETYSRNPINYSEGMADDQKDRFIQYLAEQHQEDELTIKAHQGHEACPGGFHGSDEGTEGADVLHAIETV